MTSSFTRTGGAAATRGAVLVAVAVLIGLVLLSRGFDTGSFVATGSDDEAADQAAAGDDTDTDTPGAADDDLAPDEGLAPPPTTAPDPNEILPEPRDPAEVSVAVLNGSGVSGAAGEFSDQVSELGYTTLPPGNAEPVPATVVYFTPDFQADAEDLATAIGALPTAAVPLPEPSPVEAEDADVIVVLGEDVAGADDDADSTDDPGDESGGTDPTDDTDSTDDPGNGTTDVDGTDESG